MSKMYEKVGAVETKLKESNAGNGRDLQCQMILRLTENVLDKGYKLMRVSDR